MGISPARPALAGGGVSRNGYSLKVSLDPANLFSEYDETNNTAVAAALTATSRVPCRRSGRTHA